MKSNRLRARLLGGAVVAGSVAVASMFAAAPAAAATLPSGQKITIIDQAEDQFYDASPVNGDVTPVGAFGVQIDEYITGVDVNDDGVGYAIATAYSQEVPDEDEFPVVFADGAWLYEANANTGELTGGVEIFLDFGDVLEEADYCGAIDYTNGVVTAACVEEIDEEVFATYVGVVDPATGFMDIFLELNGGSFLFFASIAVDPISGQLYGFTIEEGDGTFYGVYTLSEDEGADWVIDTEYPGFGADFDRDGQLWFTTVEELQQGEFPFPYPALATVDLATGGSPFVALYTTPDAEVVDWSEAITVWGKPALAATGATVAPVTVAAAAVVLLLGAILAAGTAARRRKAAA